MQCSEVRLYLDAYLDSELPPEKLLEMRQHLQQCPDCSEELALTREVVRISQVAVDKERPSLAFKANLADRLAHERTEQEKELREAPILSWGMIATLAAAAIFAITLGFGNSEVRQEEPVRASASENLVDLLVNNHSTSRQAQDIDNLEPPSALEPQLGFPVRVPNLSRYGATFVGANVVTMNQAHAASLHYELNGRRLTFYIYNPEELPLRLNRQLKPRVVGNRAVFVGRLHGYSVATYERGGVGYAITTDLTNEESAELVAAVEHY
ncbi:MAG: anti-sigma factor [Polyangiaceae bacterium]|nr:anti-sigma factor [Polyangiaceae bacterium]